MSQLYNDNTKRPKPKENQLGISVGEFTHFAGNSAEGLGSRRERCWSAGVTYLFMRIHPKSFSIFLLKVVATLLT